MNYSENNHLILVGKIISEKTYSHEIYGEKFYIFNLEVIRLSSTTDIIPITISERLLTELEVVVGKEVKVEGQFRSYNSYENESVYCSSPCLGKHGCYGTEDEAGRWPCGAAYCAGVRPPGGGEEV